MHVTEEVDVAEVCVGVAGAVLAQVVPEQHVQLVLLPHEDQPHVAGALRAEDGDDLAHALRHRVVAGLEERPLDHDLGGGGNSENVLDLRIRRINEMYNNFRLSKTYPIGIGGLADVHEDVEPILHEVNAVVLDLLHGAPDLMWEAFFGRIEVVQGEESGVEEDGRRGDVHRGDRRHQEGPFVATAIKCVIWGLNNILSDSAYPTSAPPAIASDLTRQLVYKGRSFMHSGRMSCPALDGEAQFFL